MVKSWTPSQERRGLCQEPDTTSASNIDTTLSMDTTAPTPPRHRPTRPTASTRSRHSETLQGTGLK